MEESPLTLMLPLVVVFEAPLFLLYPRCRFFGCFAGRFVSFDGSFSLASERSCVALEREDVVVVDMSVLDISSSLLIVLLLFARHFFLAGLTLSADDFEALVAVGDLV